MHDSTAFKASPLYRNHQRFFQENEFLIADKAYALERHVITPYKGQAGRQKQNSKFNHHLSTCRVKIEHAFGVLKARWPSLKNLPIRINEDCIEGHNRVMQWTIACLVLHNLLTDIEDDSWLGVVVTGGGDSPEEGTGAVNYREEERRAGQRRRNELQDRFTRDARTGRR